MIFYVAVLDKSRKRVAEIGRQLERYAFLENLHLKLRWFSDKASIEDCEQYLSDLGLALVSLDDEKEGRLFSKKLYELNPDCRICFYRQGMCNLQSLLTVRPIGFCNNEEIRWENIADGEPGKEDEKVRELFVPLFARIFSELINSRCVFRIETREQVELILQKNILYFQSDRKKVEVHLLNGRVLKFSGKLTDIENRLNPTFLRIHKSFIANSLYIESIDKIHHWVCMINDDNLSISDTRYKAVLAFMKAM